MCLTNNGRIRNLDIYRSQYEQFKRKKIITEKKQNKQKRNSAEKIKQNTGSAS
jgi:phage terminase small subunit